MQNIKKRERERGGGEGEGEVSNRKLINHTLFRLACTHYWFTGAFSVSLRKYVPASLLNGGGGVAYSGLEGWSRRGLDKPARWRCHGIPSGDSIETRQWLTVSGRILRGSALYPHKTKMYRM